LECGFCGEEASVFGEYGPTCGNCYFALRDFHRGRKLSEMTMSELLTLERAYTIYVSSYARVLRAIRAEIKARRATAYA